MLCHPVRWPDFQHSEDMSSMDSSGTIMIKSEPGMAVQIPCDEELNETNSGMEGYEVTIKKEPLEFVSDSDGVDNPYQCFTCGLDCESQQDLISHYETKCWAQDVASNEESMDGDCAGDSSTQGISDDVSQGNENETPQQLMFFCAFCGIASNEKQELMVHMESHIQVTYLSCAHCVHVYSNKYHLKNYKCRDESEKPHVCVHCPFRTQGWQELKDHCFTHHHRDTHPPQQNQVGLSGPATANHSLAGGLHPVPPPETSDQQVRVRLGNNDYFVVLNNFGKNPVNGVNSERMIQPRSDQQMNVVSNPINGVREPVLQSPSYLNVVSSVGGLTPLPANALVPTSDVVRDPIKADRNVSSALPAVSSGWPGKMWNIAPRPPDVPGPQNLPTVIPPFCLTSPSKPPPSGKTNVKTNVAPKAKPAYHKNKKIPCPYCDYLSRDKWNLRTHILTHTKEKPFACQMCPYRASQAAHLRKHMQIHKRKKMTGQFIAILQPKPES